MTRTVLSSLLLLSLPLTSAFPGPVKRQAGLQSTPFNAEKQYVSNQGEHAWVAAVSTDSRSACPALNAMANHGYIPHNGHVTLLQLVPALQKVFGLGVDVATVLGLIGGLFGGHGNGVSFDIGGWNPVLSGFSAGQFQGLNGISPLQGPFIMKTIADKYKAAGDACDGSSDPISSGQLGPLVDELIFRCMGNKSAQWTEGTIDLPTIKSFLTMVSNADGTFTKVPYHERIPDLWYTRNAIDPYDAELLGADIVELAMNGGFSNTCASHSNSISDLFSGVDLMQATSGAYSNADMKDGLLFMCFCTQAAKFVLPEIATKAAASDATSAVVSSAVASFTNATANMPCGDKNLKSLNLSLLGSLGTLLQH